MKNETRYIFSSGDLFQKDFSIAFKNEKGNTYLPVKDIKELYVFNDMTISTKLLNVLSKAGIMVHFYDYYGHYSGTYYPKRCYISGNTTLKQAEKYIYGRNEIAKNIVLGIAKNIYVVMYHYYRHGKKEVKDYIDFLHNNVTHILEKYNDIPQIMMVEGEIWSGFYDCFKAVLPESFVFNKRVRRPPDNPINALISFGNSILYTKTITQIYHTHLNQEISYLHSPSEGRFSLSLDLSEVFKPVIVFKTIFECVNNRKLAVDRHFESEYNYCILNEEGRRIFLKSLEDRLNSVFEHPKLKRKVTYKQAIRLDGYKLIKCVNEGKEFIPFDMELKM